MCLLFCFVFVSCSKEQPDVDEAPSVRLVSWESSFLSDDSGEMDAYFDNREAFISSYKSAFVSGDTLTITTVRDVNSCGEVVGSIMTLGDTIVLGTRQMSEEVCASIEFRLFTYKMVVPDSANYVVRY